MVVMSKTEDMEKKYTLNAKNKELHDVKKILYQPNLPAFKKSAKSF